MKITKQELVVNIHKRLGKTLPKDHINDVVAIICDYLAEELIENRSISVKNFGTLSPYIFHAHDGVDIARGIKVHMEESRTVKFRPHHVLTRLVRLKRKKFLRKAPKSK